MHFFSHLKSADFETFCDWSTSWWRNNLDTPWCNNLVFNNFDDVITLWRDVKIVTLQGHVLFTAFGKLMFEYLFLYEVNQWFLNGIAQKFWKIMGFQIMINSHDVQLVNCLGNYTPDHILAEKKLNVVFSACGGYRSTGAPWSLCSPCIVRLGLATSGEWPTRHRIAPADGFHVPCIRAWNMWWGVHTKFWLIVVLTHISCTLHTGHD